MASVIVAIITTIEHVVCFFISSIFLPYSDTMASFIVAIITPIEHVVYGGFFSLSSIFPLISVNKQWEVIALEH